MSRILWTGLVVVLAALAAFAVWGLLRDRQNALVGAGAGLPVFGEAPEFTLAERGGGTLSKSSLEGRVWVANFVFTRCAGICPLLSRKMAVVQERFAGSEEPKLVSFSVDPGHDTPDVLDRYARQYGADPNRWFFLTGRWETMRDLIGDGFHLDVSRAAPGTVPDGELVTHSDRMVLVDRHGRIRGFYHGTEDEGVERLIADAKVLIGGR